MSVAQDPRVHHSTHVADCEICQSQVWVADSWLRQYPEQAKRTTCHACSSAVETLINAQNVAKAWLGAEKLEAMSTSEFLQVMNMIVMRWTADDIDEAVRSVQRY